ncbi:MAG: OmpA family protein [Myxococcales bacterium]|nr:OmpA family protein [Myxococcales bacterium]
MSRGQYTRRITERFLSSVTPPAILGIERILLYDFDTGRSELLEEHREGLVRHVVPYLRRDAPSASVWIGGLASRRGSEAINIPLARRRAVAVERFLITKVPDLVMPPSRHGIVATSFGERLSTTHTENSEFYRSALVIVSRVARREPPPPEPPRPPLREQFHRFRIRFKGVQVDGGEILAFAAYSFEIDFDTSAPGSPPSRPVQYRLAAAGLGIGAPVGVQGADPDGPWNPFTCEHLADPGAFDGGAEIASGSHQWGPISFGGATQLTLMPEATPGSWIVIVPFQSSGSGFALSASVVVGQFRRIGPR